MMLNDFEARLAMLKANHRSLIHLPNRPIYPGNGIFLRYENPILTAEHTPLSWRYDLDPKRNRFLGAHGNKCHL